MDRNYLEKLIEDGYSLNRICNETGKSNSTVRYWLAKYGLKTKYKKPKKIVYSPCNLPIEQVKEAAKKANSYAQLLRLLDMSIHSSNYRRIRKYLTENNIDVSHFGSKKNNNHLGVPNEELFTRTTEHSFSTVRLRVIRDKLIPMDRCAICGIEPFWNGKPLTFRLDHINGDHYDNRLENMRFICANCDSQLDTYCHKNRKGSK